MHTPSNIFYFRIGVRWPWSFCDKSHSIRASHKNLVYKSIRNRKFPTFFVVVVVDGGVEVCVVCSVVTYAFNMIFRILLSNKYKNDVICVTFCFHSPSISPPLLVVGWNAPFFTSRTPLFLSVHWNCVKFPCREFSISQWHQRVAALMQRFIEYILLTSIVNFYVS